jgi:hypothetical protein
LKLGEVAGDGWDALAGPGGDGPPVGVAGSVTVHERHNRGEGRQCSRYYLFGGESVQSAAREHLKSVRFFGSLWVSFLLYAFVVGEQRVSPV